MNVGVTLGFTTIDIVAAVAQTPVAGVGVKVYNVVTGLVGAVLIIEGDQVPVKLFIDRGGKVIELPLQKGPN